jgi:hypothetical protein
LERVALLHEQADKVRLKMAIPNTIVDALLALALDEGNDI